MTIVTGTIDNTKRAFLDECKAFLEKDGMLRKIKEVTADDKVEPLHSITVTASTNIFAGLYNDGDAVDKRRAIEASFIELMATLYQEDKLLTKIGTEVSSEFKMHDLTGSTAASKLFVTKAGIDHLVSNPKFTNFYDPVTKFDVLSSGSLGVMLGVDIHSDVYRQPTQQVLTANLHVPDVSQYRVSPVNIEMTKDAITHTTTLYKLKHAA